MVHCSKEGAKRVGQHLQSHSGWGGPCHAVAAARRMFRRCRPCHESRSAEAAVLSGSRWSAPLPRRRAPVVRDKEVGVARPFRSTGRPGNGSSALERGREEECVIARPDPNSATRPDPNSAMTPILQSDPNSAIPILQFCQFWPQVTCPQFTLTPLPLSTPFNSSFRQDPYCSPSPTA